MEHNSNHPSGRSGLGSQEYRSRLLTKLNCLIAVLEVAIAKIGRSLELPGANEERLLKIRGNLENTLSICHRAKQTLEQNLKSPGSAGRPSVKKAGPGEKTTMSYRDYVELSSIDEYQRLKDLPPISENEIAKTDLDDLLRQLAGEFGSDRHDNDE